MALAATKYLIRKARKQYQCSERSYHTIMPGDLYLYCSCPPWHEMARGDKWETTRACLRCAEEFGMHNSETRGQLAKFREVAVKT